MRNATRPPGERRACDGENTTEQKPTNLTIARQVLKFFRGRSDHVAVGTNDGAHPERLQKPLTAKRLAIEHLSGRQWLGVYLMTADSRVYCTCLDFDNKPERPDPDWRRKTIKVVRLLSRMGLHPLVEISQSGRAAHVWLFFEAPVSASIPRAFWRVILKKLGIREPEIFPRQDSLGGKKLGNCVRYPLFNRSRFVDVNDDWVVLPPLPTLAAAKTTTAVKLKKIARSLGSKLSLPRRASFTVQPRRDGKTLLPPRVEQMLADEPGSNLARRWNGDTEGLTDTSRSALVFAIACCLVRRFLPTDEIESALRCWCERCDYEKGDRSDWLTYQIASAYDCVLATDRQQRQTRGIRSRLPAGTSRAMERQYERAVFLKRRKPRR